MSRLAEVAIPTLVIIGDSDVLTIPHAAAIRDGLADAQLAVVAGTTHAAPMEKPDLVNYLILSFLPEATTRQVTVALAPPG